MDLFLFPSVCNQIFDNLPVHQRLSAEEIDLQVVTVAGIGDQEIKRLPANLKTHQRTAAMVLSLFCETVLTGKVAVVRDVQAQCFHNGRTCLVVKNRFFIDIFCKEYTGIFQLLAFLQRFFYLFSWILVFQQCSRFHFGLTAIQQRNGIVHKVINHMYGTAVYIQHDVISIIFILMDHIKTPLFYSHKKT